MDLKIKKFDIIMTYFLSPHFFVLHAWHTSLFQI
jgi:hypothetical protein